MKKRKTIKEQILEAVTEDKTKHTEDCLDANDDTSALKGECICPKPTHTPTPWIVVNGLNMPEIRANNTSIADIRFNGHNEVHGQANAAFIVRAVNSHEALLASLKELVTLIENNPTVFDTWPRLRAVQAIAKAEGQP